MNILQKSLHITLATILYLLVAIPSYAAIETYTFHSVQQEQDYQQLIDELRCLVCQNQNLADSNAELAQDLRKQVHSMLVTNNQNRDEVVEYMVSRYGDFVLYKPPVKNQTYLLWAGPFLFLLLGFWWLIKTVKRSNQSIKDNKAE
ncbi:cytochrome c-type biogenesis protein [Thiomicrorhabdus sp. Kp2]|uniref:cytochrome c-type biogenesis protein n=1 Tax=Thiomicrorhabdus sp. Kp2 TaxID=1123518 RepID=UPI0003FB10C4|nr:cytochrome c-type biogenesis protein [Thiomicrorhabdus sp. Kp2]